MIKWIRKAMLRRKLRKLLEARKILNINVLWKEVDVKAQAERTGEWKANKYDPKWGMNSNRLDKLKGELHGLKVKLEKDDIFIEYTKEQIKELE